MINQPNYSGIVVCLFGLVVSCLGAIQDIMNFRSGYIMDLTGFCLGMSLLAVPMFVYSLWSELALVGWPML